MRLRGTEELHRRHRMFLYWCGQKHSREHLNHLPLYFILQSLIIRRLPMIYINLGEFPNVSNCLGWNACKIREPLMKRSPA